MMRDISMHVLDIIQNSITANAKNIKLVLKTDSNRQQLFVSIEDDGCGMSKDSIKSVVSPFKTSRSTRKVGLGIPFFKMSGEITGGCFNISAGIDKGTKIVVSYVINHIDRIPLGDIGETVCTAILRNDEIDYEIVLDNCNCSAKISTVEIKEQLGQVSISNYDVLNWVKDYINENVKHIFQGILEEIN